MKSDNDIEAAKTFKRIQRKVAKTCKDHELLSENDRLLVGLSGGKDSMVLLEILAAIRKKLPFSLELFAVHVSVIAPGFHSEIGCLEEFCARLNIPLYKLSISPDFDNTSKAPCFICSWHRRKAIFNLGKELNCNKLSFGHHRDDALNTFMMNMIYHGSISSLPYKLSMFNGRVDLIRPMLDIWEDEVGEYAAYRNYGLHRNKCQHENNTQRLYVDQILRNLSKDFPAAKANIFKAMGNSYPEYLPLFKTI